MNEDKIDSGIGELRDRMGKVETDLQENTATTKRIEAKLGKFIEFLDNLEGAMKVMDVIAKGAKPIAWVTGIAAAIAGWWAALRGGFR